MTGEVMVINPRRRRRRARKARSTHRRRPRRRRHSLALSNPRRVSRRRRRVHARRRRHSNPRLGLGSLTSGLKTGLGIGIGVVATEIGVGAAVKYIPGIPASLQAGPGRAALKIAVGGFALPFVLKAVKQPGLARDVAIGAWVSVVVDLLHQYVTPALGLSEYSDHPLGVYADQEFAGADDPEAMGATENMYGDTMYGVGNY